MGPGTKHSENRIHLYDPVGLLTDGFGSFRPSSHAVRPRRQALSYDNIAETSSNSNNDTALGIRSYDSFTDHANTTGDSGTYESFEVDKLALRSFNESFNSEVNGGIISSYDNSVIATTTTTTTTTMIDQDRNDGSLSFVIADIADEDDQSDDSTPRMWRPSGPANSKPPRTALQLPTGPKSVNASISNPTSPKSFNSSHYPSSPKSANSSILHPVSPNSVNSSVSHSNSPKCVNSSLSHPTSPKSPSSSPSQPTSPKSVNFSPINPSKSVNFSPPHTSPTHHHYQTMSPNSRTQAIAKGRKELMDLVRDLPESFYELSLKDIVDQKPEMELKKENDGPEEKKSKKESTMAKDTKKQKNKSSSKKVKKSESKKKMVRSRSVDNGRFLLKTSVFPILGSRKSKKSLAATSSFKVAPMPKAESTSSGAVKAGEKDWWRRKSCISSENEVSNGLSSNSTSSRSSNCSSRSNSSNGRRSNRFLPNCCLFNGRMIRGKK